jgi:SLBB domain/Polysaccharide biosynthesis/export protein
MADSKMRLNVIAAGLLSAALAFGRPASAQSGAGPEMRQNFETRAQLEAQLKDAEAKQSKSEAFLIHYRLDHGDFRDGDRIVIRVVRGPAALSDTLTVRAGTRVQIPQVGDISLAGVLRSELVPTLTSHLSKYLRDPFVEAVPLMRVGILGNVARPGYYYAAADLPISDVLMSAGGPTAVADLGRVSVRREGQVVLDETNTQVAIREGMSMDFLQLQAGDEISVGRGKSFPWQIVIPAVSTAVGLALTFVRMHH